MLINILSLAVIGFIVYWFWIAKPRAIKTHGQAVIDILVKDGTYNPARIEMQKGESITLRFLRKDASPCAEKVMFKDLNISTELEVDKPKEIAIQVNAAGEYSFTCEMQMYRGTLVVR